MRIRLRSLTKENAERVGGHLVMAGMLLDSDPELAYEHAQAAVRRAGRIDIVREAGALTAYATGRYTEALRELRTVRRLSGVDAHRAMEADCERGLGRPERALTVVAEAPAGQTREQRAELAIVEAGARLDLGQREVALILIEDAPRTPVTSVRLDSMRVDVLRALGRDGEADALAATLPEEEPLLDYVDLAPEDQEDATEVVDGLAGTEAEGAESAGSESAGSEPVVPASAEAAELTETQAAADPAGADESAEPAELDEVPEQPGPSGTDKAEEPVVTVAGAEDHD